jgi:glucoamylase
MLLRAGAILPADRARYTSMIRGAAGYIVRNGPATQQDRWEEDGGYSAFTIAVEISALLAAAEAMAAAGESAIAKYLTETADSWNEQIDDWAYARDTEISRQLGVDGYYMRIGYASGDAHARSHGLIPIKNRPNGNEALEAGLLISPDALALVRFGLRAADDPRILNTVKAIDALLRRDLPAGSYWYRYNDDGYGEHEDGAPFDGVGHWPVVAASDRRAGALRTRRGRPDEARRLLAALEASASSGGLIPEQIWDARTSRSGNCFSAGPPAARCRWSGRTPNTSSCCGRCATARCSTCRRRRDWREEWWRSKIPAGQNLRVQLAEPGSVRWSADGWRTFEDIATVDSGLGIDTAELQSANLPAGSTLEFTWQLKDGSWRGENFSVGIFAPG